MSPRLLTEIDKLLPALGVFLLNLGILMTFQIKLGFVVSFIFFFNDARLLLLKDAFALFAIDFTVSKEFWYQLGIFCDVPEDYT